MSPSKKSKIKTIKTKIIIPESVIEIKEIDFLPIFFLKQIEARIIEMVPGMNIRRGFISAANE